MDWGMMQNPVRAATCVGGVYPSASTMEADDDDEKGHASCIHGFLRPRLRFGLGISVSILLTDVILRFSWTLRFYHKLFPSADTFVLCTQFLEIVRYVQGVVACVLLLGDSYIEEYVQVYFLLNYFVPASVPDRINDYINFPT